MFREVIALLREWCYRVGETIWPRSRDSELRAELAHHLELAEEDLRRRGYTPTEAARLARAHCGQSENVLERLREQRSIPWFGIFTLDVKLGLRKLRKSVGLTLIGGLAMSISFGIILTVFMYFDVIVWSDSVPLEDGDRVVAIQIWDPENSRRRETAFEDFERWRTELRSLEEIGAFRTVERRMVYADGQIERVSVAAVSAAGFRVARVAPVLGRTLLEEDERAGAEPVVVIGYDQWQTQFNGDNAVVGRALRLNDTFHTIVGVMPPDFGFPINHRLWIPLQPDSPGLLPAPPAGAVFARLKPDVTLAGAQAELSAAGLLSSGFNSEQSEPPRPTVVRYAANFINDTSPDDLAGQAWQARLIIFFVSFLLIPPCANIALLVYARTVTRQEEIAVRTALGASRGRIVLQLFIEMLVLSTLAAGVALAGVRIVLGLVRRALARELERLPFWLDFDLSPEMIAFGAVLAVVAAVVIGLLPALKATASFARPGLGALDHRNRKQLGPMWTMLVVAQVAFSFAALPSAIELAWGVLREAVLGPGFEAGQYLTAQLSFDVDGATRSLETDPQIAAQFNDARSALIRQLEADPRVTTRVTTATAVPGEGTWTRIRVEEAPESNAGPEESGVRSGPSLAQSVRIDDRYFEAFDISILTGRAFQAGEYGATSTAVIVSAMFAQTVFGDANPLGRRLRYIPPPGQTASQSDAGPWYEIVGVVADRPTNPYRGAIFHPAAQNEIYPASIGFRVGSDSASLREKLRVTAALDPALRVARVQTLEELYDEQATGNYIGGFALIVGSVSVLLLSAAGTYALMAFTVNQRRREIGIRMALGARPRKLLAGIFRRALRQVSIGAALGVAVALLIQIYLPADRLGGLDVPGVLPSAVALMVVIGLIAAFGPARRTLSVDPTTVLREGG
jgi:predicted permease